MLDQTLALKEKLTRVLDRATHEAIALVLAQPETERAPAEPVLEWMTATQLARYWQLVNANDEPTTAGILKWVKRSENDHPCHTLTWVTSCDSADTRLTCGQRKKRKGDESKIKTGV